VWLPTAMRCRCAWAGEEYGVPPDTGPSWKDPAGAEVDVDAEPLGEALEVSDPVGVGDPDGDAIAEVVLLEGAVVTGGAELAVPLAQAVSASSAVAAPAAVAAIGRRAPRAAVTPPVSSRGALRHQAWLEPSRGMMSP